MSSDHWLAEARNVVVLRLLDVALTREEQLRRWTVAEVVSFLKAHDLEGPSETLFANGVRGVDLVDMSEAVLTHEFRLSGFAARRVLAARNAFLSERV